MKISAKSRYALHLMLALAMQEEGVNLSVKSVAEQQGISEKYLEQIIPVLVRSGLVRSVRGARGGYHLVKSPEDYTVGLILRTVEGSPIIRRRGEKVKLFFQKPCHSPLCRSSAP